MAYKNILYIDSLDKMNQFVEEMTNVKIVSVDFEFDRNRFRDSFIGYLLRSAELGERFHKTLTERR